MLIPTIDGRRSEDIKNELLARLKEYLPEYVSKDQENDAGAALLSAVAKLFEGTVGRLNAVPLKNYLEFLNTIGIQAQPPVAARVPLTFEPNEDAAGPVFVAAGTKAMAKAANGDAVIFETLKDFTATAAKLEKAFFVAQPDDRIYDATCARDGQAPFRFAGEGPNLQAHCLYIGHGDLLNLKQSATVAIKFKDCNIDLSPRLIECRYWNGGEWRPFRSATPKFEALAIARSRTTGETGSGAKADVYALTLEKRDSQPIEKSEVNGIESYWIRIEFKVKTLDDPVSAGFSFTDIDLTVKSESIKPEATFFNNVPLDSSADGAFLPFGTCPRTNDAFYIACADALTGTSGLVDIKYDFTKNGLYLNAAAKPNLSYEYWNGDGWAALPKAKLQKDPKSDKETLSFACPADSKPVKLHGIENHWIRVKIASGDYGREEYRTTGETSGQPILSNVLAPAISKLAITARCDESAPAPHLLVVAQNNNDYETVDLDSIAGGFRPFSQSGDEHSALYLGFSGSLAQGANPVFFHFEDGLAGRPSLPSRWEYFCAEEQSWTRLEAGVEGDALMATGVTELWVPGDAGRLRRFGETLLWIRRVFPEGIGTDEAACMKGIYLNTVWAAQRETVRDETLARLAGYDAGGRRDHYSQAYGFAKKPVLSCEVYVDESRTLSLHERETLLAEEKQGAVRTEDDYSGKERLWVRWKRVPSLLSSAAGDRHYEADFASGLVLFGNGAHGMAPPEGPDVVKADYLTGGGAAGNVGALAVEKLVSAVPLVKGVSNLFPSSGGFDAQTREEVTRRGPSLSRHRNRGITAEDIVSLVAEYRGVAKANCLPQYRGYEAGFPDCVTLVVIPESAQERPELTSELKSGLVEYLNKRVPAGLAQSGNIFVAGPVYVTASVTARVVLERMCDDPDVAKLAESLLNGFFHTVSGGPGGGGWQFGETPYLPDVRDILEGMDGVDYLEETTITLNDGERSFSVADEAEFPSRYSNRYNIICNGKHQIVFRSGPGWR